MDLPRGLAGLGQRENLGQGGMDHSLGDQAVRLVCFPIVGEVAAHDALEIHPQIAVVVFVHEAGCGRARHDGAAFTGDVDAGAESLTPRMLEHDVDVVSARELPDLFAESLPFLGVLGGLVLPELVPLGRAIDDQVGSHGAHNLGLALVGNDTHGDSTTVQRVLGRVGAQAS